MSHERHRFQNVVVLSSGVWLMADDSAPDEVNERLAAEVFAECERLAALNPQARVKDYRIRRTGEAVRNDLPADTPMETVQEV